MYLVAVPAYGRDYRSKKEVLTDWNDGKDFLIDTAMYKYDGKYFNKEQSEEMKTEGVTHISIRFKKLTMVAVIKL